MKKSLLVAPALGVLLLAAAGSVGGTVAWFSSVSSVEASIGKFQSTALDGNLELKVTADKGTYNQNNGTEQAPNIDYSTVKVNDGAKLTHASYDHANAKLVTRSYESVDGSGVRDVSGVTGWVAKADYDSQTQGNQSIYWAVSWTMEFTFTFATENQVNLYFDPTSKLFNPTNEANPIDGNTYEGFRIAFVAGSGAGVSNAVLNTRVWAPYRQQAVTGEEPNNLEQAKYVHYNLAEDKFDTDAYSGGAYANANELIGSGYMATSQNNNKFAEGHVVAQNEEKANGLLAQFKKVNTENAVYKATFTCVAWFEGTDSKIVTTEQLVHSSLSANLKFYTREAGYVYTNN